MEVVGRHLKVEPPAAAESRFSSGRFPHFLHGPSPFLSSRGRVSPLPIPEVISFKQRRPETLAVLHPAVESECIWKGLLWGLGLEKCGIQHANINSTVVFWQKAESNTVKLFPPHLS